MPYAAPAPADLKARYPAFASVDDATVQYWLTDAQREADDSWPITTDIAPAQIAVAAHNMKVSGILLVGDSPTDAIAAGVKRFKSADVDIEFADAAVQEALSGDYPATPYGQEYLRLLRRNRGGPMVTGGGVAPCCNAGFNGYAGPLPPYVPC